MAYAGANHDVFAKMLAHNPPMDPTGIRIYLGAAPGQPPYPAPVPSSWPDITTEFGSDAHANVSIYPDLGAVISGSLDSALISFMQGAPGGPSSSLSLYHEAWGFRRAYSQNNPSFSSANVRAATTHILNLAHNPANSINVKVGHIETDQVAAQGGNYADWCARNLDWYGCDIYDNSTATTNVADQMNFFHTNMNGVTDHGTSVIAITECNSRFQTPTMGGTSNRRADFLGDCWTWLSSHEMTGNSSGMLTFWNPTGNLSGPWDDSDAIVIAKLNKIFSESSP